MAVVTTMPNRPRTREQHTDICVQDECQGESLGFCCGPNSHHKYDRCEVAHIHWYFQMYLKLNVQGHEIYLVWHVLTQIVCFVGPMLANNTSVGHGWMMPNINHMKFAIIAAIFNRILSWYVMIEIYLHRMHISSTKMNSTCTHHLSIRKVIYNPSHIICRIRLVCYDLYWKVFHHSVSPCEWCDEPG